MGPFQTILRLSEQNTEIFSTLELITARYIMPFTSVSSSCYYSENSVAFIGTTFIDFAVKLSVNAEVIIVEGKMVFVLTSN